MSSKADNFDKTLNKTESNKRPPLLYQEDEGGLLIDFYKMSFYTRLVFILPICVLIISVFTYLLAYDKLSSIVYWLSNNSFYIFEKLSHFVFIAYALSVQIQWARGRLEIKHMSESQDAFIKEASFSIQSLRDCFVEQSEYISNLKEGLHDMEDIKSQNEDIRRKLSQLSEEIDESNEKNKATQDKYFSYINKVSKSISENDQVIKEDLGVLRSDMASLEGKMKDLEAKFEEFNKKLINE